MRSLLKHTFLLIFYIMTVSALSLTVSCASCDDGGDGDGDGDAGSPLADGETTMVMAMRALPSQTEETMMVMAVHPIAAL